MTEARVSPGALPFALRLRLWSETQVDIEARLQRVLADRRQRRVWGEEIPASPAATGSAEGVANEQDRDNLRD